MTIPRLLTHPDTLNDIGVLVRVFSRESYKAGSSCIGLLKFLLFDVTVALTRLPFGNWISIVYFIIMTSLIKNAVEGGEIYHILARAIQLYFIEKKNATECLVRFQYYLWRGGLEYVQTGVYDLASAIWGYTGERVKSSVSTFAKELAFENAAELETRAMELAKGAVLSAMTQRIAAEFVPAAFEMFRQSDLAQSIRETRQIADGLQLCSAENAYYHGRVETAIEYLTYDVHTVASQLSDTIALAEIQGAEQNEELVAKINGLALQLEYIKANQPDQFQAIINAAYLPLLQSSIPTRILDVFSSSKTGRKRIAQI